MVGRELHNAIESCSDYQWVSSRTASPASALCALFVRNCRRHFQQQAKDRLGIESMPEVVGMVDAIAGEIDVQLVMLDQAAI